MTSYRGEPTDVMAEVAAALTDRHIRADGSCSETHYPEAERLVEFLRDRGVAIEAEARQQDGSALRAALDRLVNAIQATDWDHGSEGAEIARALIQARVADLATLEYARLAEPDA